jgi:hypothetical protein
VAIVTRVLAEQSGNGVRLLAEAHICFRRTAKVIVVGLTESPMPLAPEKKLPQLQAEFSSEFSAEVKHEFSWVPVDR